MKNKFFTISTKLFRSLKDAEQQIEMWNKYQTFDWDSKVFEIKDIYEPKIKLVKVKVK